jgi:hypothetical protein
MKKIILGLGTVGLLFSLALVASAKVDRVPGPLDFLNPLLITYTIGGNDYHHSYTVINVDQNTGNFSGTGTYLDAPGYDETISGNISGTNISFTIVYTPASINPGYTLSVTGTINPGGSLTGDIWSAPASSLTQFTGNHGQYVSSQQDKQEAAQSRIGMPDQSKGHTK